MKIQQRKVCVAHLKSKGGIEVIQNEKQQVWSFPNPIAKILGFGKKVIHFEYGDGKGKEAYNKAVGNHVPEIKK